MDRKGKNGWLMEERDEKKVKTRDREGGRRERAKKNRNNIATHLSLSSCNKTVSRGELQLVCMKCLTFTHCKIIIIMRPKKV